MFDPVKLELWHHKDPKNMTHIGVDFDGTLCMEKWPEIGPEIEIGIQTVKDLKAMGKVIIINTCRTGPDMIMAKEWLLERDIPFDFINENDPVRIAQYEVDSRKVSADMYIDDRNPGGPGWEQVRKIFGLSKF